MPALKLSFWPGRILRANKSSNLAEPTAKQREDDGRTILKCCTWGGLNETRVPAPPGAGCTVTLARC